MDIAARVTSKGQVTIPKAVRDALHLEAGSQVVFRVVGDQAALARTRNFLELAGSISVPATRRSTPWDEVRRQTRKVRAKAKS
ncbi:MAG: AbrB/MazE/SpoVT family DNA-binding domain-containing protein [Sulfobacillus sp.]|jgi:AbrB family looped-hinge helix DNA binding protein